MLLSTEMIRHPSCLSWLRNGFIFLRSLRARMVDSVIGVLETGLSPHQFVERLYDHCRDYSPERSEIARYVSAYAVPSPTPVTMLRIVRTGLPSLTTAYADNTSNAVQGLAPYRPLRMERDMSTVTTTTPKVSKSLGARTATAIKLNETRRFLASLWLSIHTERSSRSSSAAMRLRTIWGPHTWLWMINFCAGTPYA